MNENIYVRWQNPCIFIHSRGKGKKDMCLFWLIDWLMIHVYMMTTCAIIINISVRENNTYIIAIWIDDSQITESQGMYCTCKQCKKYVINSIR